MSEADSLHQCRLDRSRQVVLDLRCLVWRRNATGSVHTGNRTGTPYFSSRYLVEGYVEHYNDARLNSAIGRITPKDMLVGRQQEIHAERDRKLKEARKWRQIHRQQAA